MDYMRNFKTALGEIFPLKKNDDEQSVQPMVIEERSVAEPVIIPRPERKEIRKSEVSVISEGTCIAGELLSSGDIDMRGEITGNISTKGNVVLAGNIKGNVSGENIELKSCTVNGDLTANGTIKVNKGTEVIGSLSAKELFIDGKVKGDIFSATDVYFKQSAFVLGNVTTNTIAIEKGGIICGEVCISKVEKAEGMFSDCARAGNQKFNKTANEG